MNRRELIKRSLLLSAFAGSGSSAPIFCKTSKIKMQIGACDWSLRVGNDENAFDIAKKIGLDGIQVNLGSKENNMHLRNPEVQTLFQSASEKTGVKISSLGITDLNRFPYKSDPQTEQWVWDSVDVASNLQAKVILLPFFYANDLRNDDNGKKEVIKRLKSVAPKAERAGIILGIESYLSAEEQMDIIQKTGSKNIKVYYDFRNSADAGYDVIKEVKWLGKDVICELHMKENGQLLANGTLNWKKIAKTLIEMDFFGSGWMQIEGAVPENANVVDSYKHNLKFLEESFGY